MKLSPRVEKVLEEWAGPKTWNTTHPCDMDRWYRFVEAYKVGRKYRVHEAELTEIIMAKLDELHGGHDKKVVRERIWRMGIIFDYLRCTKR